MGKFQSFSDYFPLACQVVSCDVGPCFNLLTPNFNNHVHKQYLGLQKTTVCPVIYTQFVCI